MLLYDFRQMMPDTAVDNASGHGQRCLGCSLLGGIYEVSSELKAIELSFGSSAWSNEMDGNLTKPQKIR
jgi:hypothetical protein